MKRLIALLIVPALALVPGTAFGHGKSKTKVYKGTFTLVGADGDYVTGNFGKVQLVDNKRNDKLSVHVRRVAAKTTYTYKLVEGVCKEGAAGGTEVAGFKYKPLRTNRKGVGNSTARSRTFTAERGVRYSVVVSAGGEVVLCAQLNTKYWHGKPKPKADKPHGKSDKPHGKSEDKAKGEDKSHGKSGDAPGHAEDKQRGKSEDAPGQVEDKVRGKSEESHGNSDESHGKSDDTTRGKPRSRR
jgi:hypothetical protein